MSKLLPPQGQGIVEDIIWLVVSNFRQKLCQDLCAAVNDNAAHAVKSLSGGGKASFHRREAGSGYQTASLSMRCLVTRPIGPKLANARSRVHKLLFRAMTPPHSATTIDDVEANLMKVYQTRRPFEVPVQGDLS